MTTPTKEGYEPLPLYDAQLPPYPTLPSTSGHPPQEAVDPPDAPRERATSAEAPRTRRDTDVRAAFARFLVVLLGAASYAINVAITAASDAIVVICSFLVALFTTATGFVEGLSASPVKFVVVAVMAVALVYAIAYGVLPLYEAFSRGRR
ncbi:unnamed protein product [Peniophora sp. CBMAI 1063]|nr:unnamed protein product [Peniophora sp. CBMAI 1063]